MEGTIEEIKDVERVTKPGAEIVKDESGKGLPVYTKVYKKVTTNSPSTLNIIRFWYNERENRATVKITHSPLIVIVAVGIFTAVYSFSEATYHFLKVLN